MTNLKIGTVLIAKEDRFMYGESFKPWAIKDNPYKIIKYRSYKDDYIIIDEQGDEHFIGMDYINQYFTIKRYTLSDLQTRTDLMVRIENEEQAKKLKDAGINFSYHYNHSFYGYERRINRLVWLDEKEQQGRILLESIDEIDLGDEGKGLTMEDFIEPIAMKAGDKRVLVNGLVLPVDFRIISEDNYKLLESEIARLKGDNEKLIEEKRILISQLKESYGIDRQSPDLTKRERMAWEAMLSIIKANPEKIHGNVGMVGCEIAAQLAYEYVDQFLAKSKEVKP